jgi:DNA polymerase-3 subunit alpha
LFDECEAEVRQFCKRRLAEVSDASEPQTLAGIVTDLRVINGQRGRVGLFRLDDGSDAIEAVVDEKLLEANRELLRDDELIIVTGKVQQDRFAGGLRLNVNQVWDLTGARAKFGRYLSLEMRADAPPPLLELLRSHPARTLSHEGGESTLGLAVRVKLSLEEATAELDLGEESRFWPSSAALQACAALVAPGQARIRYEV